MLVQIVPPLLTGYEVCEITLTPKALDESFERSATVVTILSIQVQKGKIMLNISVRHSTWELGWLIAGG